MSRHVSKSLDSLRDSLFDYNPASVSKPGTTKRTPAPRIFHEAAHHAPPPNSHNQRSSPVGGGTEVHLLDRYPTYVVRLRFDWATLLNRRCLSLDLSTLTEHCSGWANREPFPWLWFHARSMSDASNRYHPLDNPLPTIPSYAAARLWCWSLNQWVLPTLEIKSPSAPGNTPKRFYDAARFALARYGISCTAPALTGTDQVIERYAIQSNHCRNGKRK